MGKINPLGLAIATVWLFVLAFKIGFFVLIGWLIYKVTIG